MGLTQTSCHSFAVFLSGLGDRPTIFPHVCPNCVWHSSWTCMPTTYRLCWRVIQWSPGIQSVLFSNCQSVSKMLKNGCLQTNWNSTKTKQSFLLLLHVAIIIFWLTYACHLTIPPFSHLRQCAIWVSFLTNIWLYGWSCYFCMQNS